MATKNYNTYTPSPGDKYSPYADMAKDVYGKDTSINKSTCPTAAEIDWSKRVVNLDQGPRPKYYGGVDNPYEVIKVCEAWELDKDAYLFNVVKYVARAGKKDETKELEDLKKAAFYLDRKIKNLEK